MGLARRAINWLLETDASRTKTEIVQVDTKAPNHTPPVLNPNIGTGPIYPRGEYIPIAQAAYRRNDLVFAALRKLTSLFCSAPLRVYDQDGNAINDHPVRKLLKRPNPFMGETELFEITLLHYHLAGNAFWEKVRGPDGMPIELWPLRPDRVQIVPSKTDYIAGYIYQIAGTNYPLDRDDIIHFKMPDPLDDYWGMPPLLPALREIAVDNEATDFAKVMLQNFGIPGIAIINQNGIDKEIAERIKGQYRQKFGKEGRGEPIMLQAGMDVKQIAFDLKQLAFADLRRISETRILSALQMPAIMVGAASGLERSTYANYEEARRATYEDTIEPMHNRFDDKLEVQLLAEFDSSGLLELGFDNTEVAALSKERQQEFDNAEKAFSSGLITRNEGRRSVGEEEDPAGDVYLQPSMTTPVKFGEDPVPPAPAANPAVTKPGDAAPVDPAAVDPAPGANAETKAAKDAEKKAASNRTIVARRGAIAEKHAGHLKAWAQAQFRKQAQGVGYIVKYQRKALTPDTASAITEELARLEEEWRMQAASSVAPLLGSIIHDAGNQAAADLGIKFDLSNADVQQAIQDYSFKFAQQISSTSADEIRTLMSDSIKNGWSTSELSDALALNFENWDSSRADMVAKTESIRAANSGAIESYRQGGITQKVWIADDESCPYCDALNGTVIGIDDSFLSVGQSFQPDGAAAAMKVGYEDVNGPPAHPNCMCAVGAEVE